VRQQNEELKWLLLFDRVLELTIYRMCALQDCLRRLVGIDQFDCCFSQFGRMIRQSFRGFKYVPHTLFPANGFLYQCYSTMLQTQK
jgi:hypothetical protein